MISGSQKHCEKNTVEGCEENEEEKRWPSI